MFALIYIVLEDESRYDHTGEFRFRIIPTFSLAASIVHPQKRSNLTLLESIVCCINYKRNSNNQHNSHIRFSNTLNTHTHKMSVLPVVCWTMLLLFVAQGILTLRSVFQSQDVILQTIQVRWTGSRSSPSSLAGCTKLLFH